MEYSLEFTYFLPRLGEVPEFAALGVTVTPPRANFSTPSISFDNLLNSKDTEIGYKFIRGKVGKSARSPFPVPHLGRNGELDITILR